MPNHGGAVADVLSVVDETGAGSRATGYDDDALVRAEGEWRIARRRYTTLHMSASERG